MTYQRKHSRVDVNLLVSCFFSSDKIQKNIYTMGSVSDLSVGGMKVSLPFSGDSLPATPIHYSLQLPAPFSRLSGNGKVMWQRQDASNQRLLFGLAFSSLNYEQRKDLECIIDELQEETVKA